MYPKVDMSLWSFMDEHHIVLKCGFARGPHSQVPLMPTTPNMEEKSQLLSPKSFLKYSFYGILIILIGKNALGTCVASSVYLLLDLAFNISPKPHLQKCCYIDLCIILGT